MSFLEKIKRRNVVKVAILYVALSWLILQLTDVLSSLLSVPESTGAVVVMILALGFFPALLFSWVYELTPEGLKRESEIDRSQSVNTETDRRMNILIVVLVILGIGLVLAERLMGQVPPSVLVGVVLLLAAAVLVVMRMVPSTTSTLTPVLNIVEADRPVIDATLDSDTSIAVLPFVNMSSDEEQEFFSDGIAEELLNLLAQIPQLRVAARTSSFSFKGQNLKIPDIAQRLGVANVLEGSVRKSGNQVRITAQLIKAADGYHLWSSTYDRTLDNIFAVQDEIAAEVVGQLKITLLGAAPTARETQPEAYALYLQARHLGHMGTTQAWEKAIVFYQKALDIDPNYVAALDGLATVFVDLTDRGQRPIEEGYSKVKEIVGKALAVDPEYAKGHARLGHIASVFDNDPESAARHYQRALELDATDLDILDGAAVLSAHLGRLEQAIALGEYVVARDPVSAISRRRLGTYYFWAGRLDDAIDSFRTVLTLSPGYVATWQMIGIALLKKGKPEEALAAVLQETWEGYREMGLVAVYHALGRTAESDAALEGQIKAGEQVIAFNLAYVLAFRGEADRAFAWLEKAVQYKDPGLCQITVVPMFSNLYSDPRWEAFLRRIGKSRQQLDAIDFEVVLPS